MLPFTSAGLGLHRMRTSHSAAGWCACGRGYAAGELLVRCATLTCAAAFHLPCAGLTAAAGAPARWRCPECRVRTMVCVGGVVERVAARGLLLPGCGKEGCGGCGAPAAMELRWELRAQDPVFVLSSRCALQLVCVQSSCLPGTELTCQWPAGAALELNGKTIATPLPAAPNHSAPLLTASPAEFLTLQTNCLRLRTPGGPRPACVVLAIVVSRFGGGGGSGDGAPGLQAELAWQVLLRRCLAPGLAQLVAVRAPLGGVPSAAARAEGDLASLIDAWRPQSALLLPGVPGAPRSAGMGIGVAAAPEAGSGGGGSSSGSSGGSSSSSSSSSSAAPAEVDIDTVSLSLKDPLTQEPIVIPVRGDACKHTDCMDLHTYLRHNLSGKGRWTCMRCKERVLPQGLYVDTVQLALLQRLVSGERGGSVRGAVDRAELGAQKLVAWAADAAKAAADCTYRVELSRDGTWAQQTGKRSREGTGRGGSPSSSSGSGSGVRGSAVSSSSSDSDDEDPPWVTNAAWGKGAAEVFAGIPAAGAAAGGRVVEGRGVGGGGGGSSSGGGGGGGGSGGGSGSGSGGRAEARPPRAPALSLGTDDDDVIVLGPDGPDFIDLTND